MTGFRTQFKALLRKKGYELHRVSRACYVKDAFIEQKSLLSDVHVHTIFDIGAHEGETALKYRKLFPSALIHSFEPSPDSYERLENNFKDTDLVKPVPLAVSDKSGKKAFYLNKNSYTNSLLSGCDNSLIETAAKIEVPVTTIDDYCRRESIDAIQILKMDIQGGELMALEGATEQLKRHSISLIYTEVLFAPMYDEQASFFNLCGFLYEYGYSLFDQYNFAYKESGQLWWGDAIFTPPRLIKN